MRKISNFILSMSLFILGTYGERIFGFVYTLLLQTPPDDFITFCVLASALFLVSQTLNK